jgi:hypothetical protein
LLLVQRGRLTGLPNSLAAQAGFRGDELEVNHFLGPPCAIAKASGGPVPS